jgi:hypothetical protein
MQDEREVDRRGSNGAHEVRQIQRDTRAYVPERPIQGVLNVDFRAVCAGIWRRLCLSAALPVQREGHGVQDGWDGREDSLLSPQSALVSSQCCRDKAPVVIEVVLTVVDFRLPGQPCLRSEE